MFDEDDLLPLSGLQHLAFCERQWALIHLEQQWEENRLTAEGRVLHERVHDGGTESRPGVVIARGVHIRSLRLGVSGIADVVEFEVASGGEGCVPLAGRDRWWRPFPVEYKRGKPKPDACDEVQLCAQAMCLEEMFGVRIEAGALFYGKTRRRAEVRFDGALRAATEAAAQRMRELYTDGRTPPASYGKKCDSCSLAQRCLPRAAPGAGRVASYIRRTLREVARE
jgi:CRISPR-associated exonuclease Cas4